MGIIQEYGLTPTFLEELSTCVNSKSYEYRKGEYITNLVNNKSLFAILKKGNISLWKMDEEGNCLYIEKYQKYDLFTKLWHQEDRSELLFLCETDTEIMLIDYQQLIRGCPHPCPKHYMILDCIIKKIIDYTNNLNQKLALLQIKKLEDRILAYLQNQRKEEDNTIILQTSYKELANYLYVDRSSFMRKLKELEEKKKIKRNGKIITIL